jgi:death-on-curing protein
MGEPVFLTLDDVLQIHAYQVEHFGGDPAVLDRRLLESAIAQPQQAFGGEYLHADLAAMAAAYLYHLVKNHPFADGNKRTGTQAAMVFLELNGHGLDYPLDETEQLVLGVAEGRVGKDEVAAFLRPLMQPGR